MKLIMNLDKYKVKINASLNATLRSYSQIFFSENKFFSILLLLVSFIDFWAGISGIIAVTVCNLTAFSMGFNKEKIKKGLYGYNALLVGIGTGLNFEPGIVLLILIIFAALLTLIITINIEGILSKYSLPFLSIPFLFGIWIVILASSHFDALGLSHRGIYTYNELYSAGGSTFVKIYDWFNSIKDFEILKIYLLSLGAIFFQNNLLAGILIAIGLLIYSRIAFTLSITGFFAAFYFYEITGSDFAQLEYTFIGFNYILTSIAIGGYFVIPSAKTYLWTLILLPITVIITISLQNLFLPWGIPIYSLPFNIVVILFIYALRQRITGNKHLTDTFTKQNTPEKTLYLNKTYVQIIKDKNFFPINLPFWGKWTISQAHEGEYTHKGFWKEAWDFIIVDKENSQFKSSGEKVEDYLCYGKNIIAPASGYVMNINDGIKDNKIGDINTVQNWGNSIVIMHAEYLYSQLSHLKSGSFRVKAGEYVQKGQVIAEVGNSGHSPYPHLHFQIQASPFVGSKTIEYPLTNYISENETTEYKIFGIPKLNDKISQAVPHELIKEAIHLIPGQKISVISEIAGKSTETVWEVEKDYYNQTFIQCTETKSTAYFYSDETGFWFNNFYGNKKSLLFNFFIAFYNVKSAFYKDVSFNSFIRPNLFFNKILMFFQDFISPVYLFLKSEFKIFYIEEDADLSPEYVILKTTVKNSIFGNENKLLNFEIKILKSGIIQIIDNKSNKITINTKI